MHVLPGPARNLVFVFVFFFGWPLLSGGRSGCQPTRSRSSSSNVPAVTRFSCSLLSLFMLVGTSSSPSGVLKGQAGSLDSFRLSTSSLAPVPIGFQMDCSGIGLSLPCSFIHQWSYICLLNSTISLDLLYKWTSYFLFNISSLLLLLLIWI